MYPTAYNSTRDWSIVKDAATMQELDVFASLLQPAVHLTSMVDAISLTYRMTSCHMEWTSGHHRSLVFLRQVHRCTCIVLYGLSFLSFSFAVGSEASFSHIMFLTFASVDTVQVLAVVQPAMTLL